MDSDSDNRSSGDEENGGHVVSLGQDGRLADTPHDLVIPEFSVVDDVLPLGAR